MEIRRLGERDEAAVIAAAGLFDEEPTVETARAFLGATGNHCLIAYVEGTPVGFVTGVEIAHPDAPTEMLLYELGVDEGWRGRGVGRALVTRLRDIARDGGARGMWVLTEPDNAAALATYRSAGADRSEPAVVVEWRFDDA